MAQGDVTPRIICCMSARQGGIVAGPQGPLSGTRTQKHSPTQQQMTCRREGHPIGFPSPSRQRLLSHSLASPSGPFMVELFTAARFARSPRSDRSGSPCRHGTGSPRQHRLNGRFSPASPVADLQPHIRPRTGFKHDGLKRDCSRSSSLSASPASDGCGPPGSGRFAVSHGSSLDRMLRLCLPAIRGQKSFTATSLHRAGRAPLDAIQLYSRRPDGW